MEVSEILEAIDPVEYISQYVDLEERGGEFWGLSPFKQENTPSFSVNREKGFWYDFSAGAGGNLIDFVMRYHGVTLVKAICLLKAYAGIEDDGNTHGSTRLLATKIAKRYRNSARPQRQVSYKPLPADYMNRYEFNKEKLRLWHDEGIGWDAMRRYGVMYDSFANRIVFPIKDFNGQIISVCGRTCDPDYKRKGLRKYTYYMSLGLLNTIYAITDNMQYVLEKRELILFEGAKSCMIAYGWGIKNTGALLTSHLSYSQFQYLIRLCSFHGIRVVFALDAEIDIMLDENIMKLRRYASVEWIKNYANLLSDKDSPVDRGEQVFRKLCAKRTVVS